jgi:dipeptide/tripeptide permease
LFGHPKGLFFLAFTETWERFSFYGMTALVVLYMVDQLFLPGHVEHIAGFAGFRAAIETVVGPLSPQALASQIYGLYAGFVYFTPLLGGLIADRWIGQRNAVVTGALLMCAGHFAMAFEQSFLVALALLVTGSGFLKGNISAQVGALYPPRKLAVPAASSFSAPASMSGPCAAPCYAARSRSFLAGTTVSVRRGSLCSQDSLPICTAIVTCRRGCLSAVTRSGT